MAGLEHGASHTIGKEQRTYEKRDGEQGNPHCDWKHLRRAGISTPQASALKVKAEILSAILEHIRREGYTQAQLVSLLDEYQPPVSNLLKGKIAQVSIERLLRYADRSGLSRQPYHAHSDLPALRVGTLVEHHCVAGP